MRVEPDLRVVRRHSCAAACSARRTTCSCRPISSIRAILSRKGIGSDRDLFTYAIGRIVVWVPASSTLPIERDGLRALTGASAYRDRQSTARAVRTRGRGGTSARRSLDRGQPEARARRERGAGGAVRPERRCRRGHHRQVAGPGAGDAQGGRSWDVPENAYPPLTQGGLILPWAASREAARSVPRLSPRRRRPPGARVIRLRRRRQVAWTGSLSA